METTKKRQAAKKSKPLKIVGKTHATVSEMVRDTSSSEFAAEFDQYQ